MQGCAPANDCSWTKGTGDSSMHGLQQGAQFLVQELQAQAVHWAQVEAVVSLPARLQCYQMAG